MMTRRHTASEGAIGFGRNELLSNVGFSTRTFRILQNHGLITIGDMADAFAVLQIAPNLVPGFGRVTLHEISDMLNRCGIRERVPVVSKYAAEILYEMGIKKQDIVRYFGAGGQYGPSGTNFYRLRHVDRPVLEELRSIAKFYEELA